MFRRSLLVILLLSVALVLNPGETTAKEPLPAFPREATVHGVEFILIPAGWFFKSGGVGEYSSHPQGPVGHVKVWLDDFYIARYEARARDLIRFMNETGKENATLYGGDTDGCSMRRNDRGEYYPVGGERDLPATHLSWELADRWARWMGFRLPTEAEWEKAARGPDDQRVYPWGDTVPDETYAWFQGGIPCNPMPVHYFPKGVSPYGVYNMAGNVREMVQDWLNPDADARQKDGMRNPPPASQPESIPPLFKSHQRIMKGGRWMMEAAGIRIVTRNTTPEETPFICNGVRFAADVETILSALIKEAS